MFWVVFACLRGFLDIHGNWSDSSVKDETVIFFEENGPELLGKVARVIEDVPDDESSILSSLRKYVPQSLFGLLNLSLALRFYHPKAALRKPINRQPVLRGWNAVFERKKRVQTELRRVNNPTFTGKFAAYLKNRTAEEQLDLLATASTDLSRIAGDVMKASADSAWTSKFKSGLEKYRVNCVNGRSVRDGYFGILEALLEEYRYQKFFGFSKNVLTLESSKKVFHYSEFPPQAPKLEAHDFKKNFDGWPETPNMNSKDSWGFLRNKKPMLNVHVYFSLSSPESPALLEWALDVALGRRPAALYLILVSDLTNATERQITYAWLQSVSTLGTRNACIFMLEGFKKGFKRAYRATLPRTKWKELVQETANSTLEKNFLKLQEYTRSRNIRDVAVSINGDFIQKKPLLQWVDYEAQAVAERVKDATYAGELNWSQEVDILDWYKSSGLVWDNATYPLQITPKNHVSIHNFALDDIDKIAEKLASVAYLVRDIPVVTSDNLTKVRFSADERRFLRYSGTSEMTIVGGYIFKKLLDVHEIEYAAAYAKHSLCASNLERNLTTKQLLLCLFLRSTMSLQHISRQPVKDVFDPETAIRVGNQTSLVWTVATTLFEGSSSSLAFAKYVADAGAATVVIHPLINPNLQPTYLSNHLIVPVIGVDKAEAKELQSASYSVDTPNEWIYKVHSEDILVERIIHYGFSDDKDGVIQIGGFERRPTSDAGYFQVSLPVGSHKIKHAVEKYFNVDRLIPVPCFYSLMPITKEKSVKDDTLNVVVCLDEPRTFTNITNMLYTITENTTAPVKLWLIDSTRKAVLPKGVDYEVLPNYYPYLYMAPSDKSQQLSCWKFFLADIYLPINAQVLFVDTNVIFYGDASRFQRLDMSVAVAAAPVMTDSWWHKRGKPWMNHDMRRSRMDRPYHTTSVVFVDVRNWINVNASSIFREMISERIKASLLRGNVVEEIFNVMQLNVQILSLPEETAYCSARSPDKLAKKALAVVLCARDSPRIMGIKIGKLTFMAGEKYKADEL